ncbi:MAG: hypothetical protein XE04_1569 [Marinimicrobia bacterium 46_43]|nr:MAG: hypothetical protein XE04_1569 [Marinimicrobia bacterium 46_43]
MPKKNLNKILMIFLIGFAALALMLAIYFLPPVHDRLSWRMANLRASIFYFFNPPDEVAFSPAQQAEMEAIVKQTQTAMAPTPTSTLEPSATPTNFISPTPTRTPSPTPSPTPIPRKEYLEGIVWENQKLYNNYCGPANLSMALSFWGWDGDQSVTGPWLKPLEEDRNVMPYEMVDFVRTQTNFHIIQRWGGDLNIIKKFIAAGFPVMIERGFEEEVPNDYWMGHYNLINGYDDEEKTFIIQDSFVGEDYSRSYEMINLHWRAFNYVYMVIYPKEREQEIFRILGSHADEIYNYEFAAEKAQNEISVLDGQQLFFAWFNYGTSLRFLNDYYGAAQAYDKAYEILGEMYEGIDPLYRILWYQTGPYFAYYNTGRYQDLLSLTTKTINSSFVPAIEESWVWRGRAKVALGDIEGGIEDFREALKWHPDWWVAEAELHSLGVTP